MEVDDGDPLDLHADLCRRREAGDLVATDIVPGARTVLSTAYPTRRRWPPTRGTGNPDTGSVVDAADLPLLAQGRPGDTVRFVVA